MAAFALAIGVTLGHTPVGGAGVVGGAVAATFGSPNGGRFSRIDLTAQDGQIDEVAVRAVFGTA